MQQQAYIHRLFFSYSKPAERGKDAGNAALIWYLRDMNEQSKLTGKSSWEHRWMVLYLSAEWLISKEDNTSIKIDSSDKKHQVSED